MQLIQLQLRQCEICQGPMGLVRRVECATKQTDSLRWGVDAQIQSRACKK